MSSEQLARVWTRFSSLSPVMIGLELHGHRSTEGDSKVDLSVAPTQFVVPMGPHSGQLSRPSSVEVKCQQAKPSVAARLVQESTRVWERLLSTRQVDPPSV